MVLKYKPTRIEARMKNILLIKWFFWEFYPVLLCYWLIFFFFIFSPPLKLVSHNRKSWKLQDIVLYWKTNRCLLLTLCPLGLVLDRHLLTFLLTGCCLITLRFTCGALVLYLYFVWWTQIFSIFQKVCYFISFYFIYFYFIQPWHLERPANLPFGSLRETERISHNPFLFLLKNLAAQTANVTA